MRRQTVELSRIKAERSTAGIRASGKGPEEMEAERSILRLQQQVRSLRSEIAGLRGALDQARIQQTVDTVRQAVEDAVNAQPSTAPQRENRERRDDVPSTPRRSSGGTAYRERESGERNDSPARPVPGIGANGVATSGLDATKPDMPNTDGYNPLVASGVGSQIARDRAESAAVRARAALGATVDRLIMDASSVDGRSASETAWNLARTAVSDQAKEATDRMAAVAGDQNRTAATRWVAGVAGTFTQTFTGETTRKEYGAAAERVGSYIENAGSAAGLAPGGQVASAELSALGAGFSLAGKLMQAEKPLDEAMKLGSAAGLVDVVRHRVKNGYLGAALDGVSVASQLLPGEDQDYVGAAIKVFEGVATTKVDAHFSKELEALKAERAGGRWARGGVYSDMQRKKQQGLLDTAIGVPGNVKTITKNAPRLLDEITGGGDHGQDPHK